MQTSQTHVQCPHFLPNVATTTQVSIGVLHHEKPVGLNPNDHVVISIMNYDALSQTNVAPWVAPTNIVVSGSGFPVNETCTCMFGDTLVRSEVVVNDHEVLCDVPPQPPGDYPFQLSCSSSGWAGTCCVVSV